MSLNYSNLTREKRRAIKSLKEDENIVIKEADKGSAVVVWDRENYLKEMCNYNRIVLLLPSFVFMPVTAIFCFVYIDL